MRIAMFLSLMMLLTPACSSSSDTDADPPNDSDTDTDVVQTEYPEPERGLTDQTVEHDGMTREYILYVPDTYSSESPTPLMLNFHGFGGTANGMLAVADMRSLADANNFLLIYPQGALLDGESHWNTYPAGGTNKSTVDDIGFVGALLDQVEANYNIDTTRVYATGYSNGADMTYNAVCYLSDRFTGIAPQSGQMWQEVLDSCNPTHPTPVLHIHGTNDGARPYGGYDGYLVSIQEGLDYWADHNQIVDAPELTEFQDGNITVQRYDFTGGEGNVSMRHYRMVNGGHLWFDFEDEGVSQRAHLELLVAI